MKTNARLLTPLLLGLTLALAGFARAQTPDPQAALTQAVAELQKNPADTALRERIIKLAAEMNPAPAIPEEAKRFMVRGATAFKAAKSPEDARDAVAEFEKATLAAPWLADAYNNLGVAQDKAGLYAEAIQSLKWYLLAAPNASDAEAKQALIYEVEYRRDKAAKDAQLAAQKAAQEQAEQQAAERRRQEQVALEARAREAAETRARADAEVRARLDSVEGNWIGVGYFTGEVSKEVSMKIRKHSNGEWGIEFPWEKEYAYDIKHNGRSISFTKMIRGADPTLNTTYISLSLSSDGTEMVGTRFISGATDSRPGHLKYRRQ